jgi:imidazolonepropionase-like amidohydrolase
MVKMLHEAKVSLVVGTDELAGLMVHQELVLFVRAGISPADALRAATLEPARLMKQDKKSGSIAPGKVADMFIVDGDPLARIDDVAKIVSTMRGGVLFASAALYETVDVRH